MATGTSRTESKYQSNQLPVNNQLRSPSAARHSIAPLWPLKVLKVDPAFMLHSFAVQSIEPVLEDVYRRMGTVKCTCTKLLSQIAGNFPVWPRYCGLHISCIQYFRSFNLKLTH